MPNQISQDRRRASRANSSLRCTILVDGTEHPSVIADVSINGAFLVSSVLPSNGSAIILKLDPPLVERAFSLRARVVRGDWEDSESGKIGKFGIEFGSASLDLIKLVSQLASKNVQHPAN